LSFGRLRAGDVLAIAHLRYRVEEVRAEPASRVERSSTPDDGRISLGDPPDTALHDGR
jgi:hypothetical protein